MPPVASVSILVAAHNRCELLARTLESLGAIELPEGVSIECIVVANACTDDTEGVVRRAASAMPFPTRVVAEPRRGVSFARNRAVEECRHDLCLFIDSDCLADPRWLIEHLRVYAERGADLVTGRIDLWWAEGDPPPAGSLSRSMREALGEHRFSEQTVRLAEPRAYAANFSFRREVFGAAGPFRTDIGRSGLSGRLAHEEQVFARRAMGAGYALWFAPDAVVRHFVPRAHIEDGGEFFTRSAYWGSVSTMLAMERLGAGEVARTLLKSPARAAISQAALAMACARGDRMARMRARMDRAGAVGRLVGLARRMGGGSGRAA